MTKKLAEVGGRRAELGTSGDLSVRRRHTGARFGPKVGQMAPNGTNLVIFFSEQIQYKFCSPSHLLKTIPGFVPFLANLNQFGAKSGYPAMLSQVVTFDLCDVTGV